MENAILIGTSVLLFSGMLINVAKVGKPREPMTPNALVVSIILSLVVISGQLYILLGGK